VGNLGGPGTDSVPVPKVAREGSLGAHPPAHWADCMVEVKAAAEGDRSRQLEGNDHAFNSLRSRDLLASTRVRSAIALPPHVGAMHSQSTYPRCAGVRVEGPGRSGRMGEKKYALSFGLHARSRVPLLQSGERRVLPLVAQPTKSMISPKAVDDLTALLCAAPGS
jgi:hypothetical protein